ncbi:MAG: methyltransferase domain-containing protein [Deltaproteobacteria bacterium]|nr:MAG: methyltransferase domain-containing protein [Deltaproteobacteria bacterium]
MSDYEDILYDEYSFPQAHPSTVAAVAQIHGAPMRAHRGLRVLDLGCGCGSHLLPMAERDPEGRYIGLDLSRAQIAVGEGMVHATGLENVQLMAGDIRDLSSELGRFDLIVCHGVYSWVPPDVRAAILRVLRQHLAAHGVAFLSTNMLPGWRSRGTLRAGLLRHVDPTLPPREKIDAARRVLDFWADAAQRDTAGFGPFLTEELRALQKASDSYLLYEHLAPLNEPMWFSDLHRAFGKAQLSYLGDACLAIHAPLGDVSEQRLRGLASSLAASEELRDLATHRMFRRSLLVHRERVIDREVHWRRLEGLYFHTALRPTKDGGYQSSKGLRFQTSSAVERAILDTLSDTAPRLLPFDEIVERVGERRAAVGKILLGLTARGLILPLAHDMGIAAALPTRPRATKIARFQAEHRPRVTNLRHESIEMPRSAQCVLRHCDGTRDPGALADHLAQDLAQGKAEILVEGEPVQDRPSIEEAVDLALDALHHSAMFLQG